MMRDPRIATCLFGLILAGFAACSGDDEASSGAGGTAGSSTAGTGGSAGGAGSGSGGKATGGSSGPGGETSSSGGTTSSSGGTENTGGVAQGGESSTGLVEGILFASDASTSAGAGGAQGDFELWLMDVDGQNKRQITDDDAYDSGGRFSPDGTKIVWEHSVDLDTNVRDIYVMDVDGTNYLNLTDPNAVVDQEPAWSPDGNYVVYSSYEDDAAYSKLFRVNADDSMPGAVWIDEDDSAGHPSWVGDNIAYDSARDGNLDVWVKGDNDSDVGSNLTSTSDAVDDHPAISPDGTKIAFVSFRDGDAEVFVMNANGTGVTQLTVNVDTDTAPGWSADSTKIVFVSNRDGSSDIWVMDADGGNQTNLTPELSESVEGGPYWGLYAP